jgi:hypothetical protein
MVLQIARDRVGALILTFNRRGITVTLPACDLDAAAAARRDNCQDHLAVRGRTIDTSAEAHAPYEFGRKVSIAPPAAASKSEAGPCCMFSRGVYLMDCACRKAKEGRSTIAEPLA